MKIAIQGLGRMGMQIAQKIAESDHTVIAHNRSKDKIDHAAGFGAVAAYEKQDVISAFDGDPIIIWIMLPDTIVDEEVDEWLPLLPQGSVIIDGGNSDYRNTIKLAERIEAAGMKLLDIGVSGGIWGYGNGFPLMCGGNDRAAFESIEPILQVLSAPGGAYQYFGSAGAGHFVKMTHNAIEYGMMQSLAEGYRVLKDGPYPDMDLAAAGEVWHHHSVITSWLNELSRDALRENPNLDGIDGFIHESGEARWTLETAKAYNISMPSIQAAFDVRVNSVTEKNFATKLVAAMRNKFGGHDLNS